MKKSILLFLSLFLSLCIPSYAQSTKTELQTQVREINRFCPMNAGEGVTLESMIYNKDVNQLSITIGMRSANLDLDAIKQNSVAMGENVVKNWCADQSVLPIMKNCAACGARINLIYKDLNKNKSTSIFIPNSTIRRIVDGGVSSIENSQANLENYIKSERAGIGNNLAQGMKLLDVRDVGSYIDFVFGCDESIYNIDAMNAGNADNKAIRSVIVDLVKDPIARSEMKCFAENGKGIRYTYIGNTSKKKCIMSLNFEQLADIANQ